MKETTVRLIWIVVVRDMQPVITVEPGTNDRRLDWFCCYGWLLSPFTIFLEVTSHRKQRYVRLLCCHLRRCVHFLRVTRWGSTSSKSRPGASSAYGATCQVTRGAVPPGDLLRWALCSCNMRNHVGALHVPGEVIRLDHRKAQVPGARCQVPGARCQVLLGANCSDGTTRVLGRTR
jgi:hypothetical protein